MYKLTIKKLTNKEIVFDKEYKNITEAAIALKNFATKNKKNCYSANIKNKLINQYYTIQSGLILAAKWNFEK